MFGAYASFAVLDPELTASVPAMQVISGAFDTLSHAMETYLGNSDQDNVSDDLALAVMRNTVVNMRRLLEDVNDMQARSNLMGFGHGGERYSGRSAGLRIFRRTRSSISSAHSRTAITDRDLQ